jgi:hypothetical protein
LLRWTSILTLTITLGLWAGGSWLWHRFVGPNHTYKLSVKNQNGEPIAGARLSLEAFVRQERYLEIPQSLASVQGKGAIRSSVVLTSDLRGVFTPTGLQADQLAFHELSHPEYSYAHPSPYDVIKRNHIFIMSRKNP